jgi:predicted nucleic acid-binding protein
VADRLTQRPLAPLPVNAARLRARHPISLPDAYLLATARHLEATVTSFDTKVLRAAGRERIPVSAE